MSDPKFYKFDPTLDPWPDLQPGDCFVAPYAQLFRMDDWYVRGDKRTKVVSTRNNPLLVLGRIDQVVGAECPGDSPPGVVTLIVFSISKGFLITAAKIG